MAATPRQSSNAAKPLKAAPPDKALPSLPQQATEFFPGSDLAPRNTRPSKRLAPGLEERLRRLEAERQRRERARRSWYSIGKIPEEQLEELERLERARGQGVEVVRRGTAWTGPPVRVEMPTSGGVRLDGGPVLTDTEQSVMGETDVSSIISFSEGIAASESEDEFEDKNKYRMPEGGKTRLHLRTKEPLSPTPRQTAPTGPRQQLSNSTPLTPTLRQSPERNPSMESIPWANGRRNDSNDNFNASDSDFISSGLSRAGSIYTLSRVSFEGQLSKLTSMRLPDPNSLAKKIASHPTANEAAKALTDASEQIRMWISKASEVLNGLNAEDDVEWAAAGGREGIEDVDHAINRFERLVQVYILSIERLQVRDDVGALSEKELMGTVLQMESILNSWGNIKKTLNGVKEQVEIAMEWEELWNSVLGEIGQEMEVLNRLVFEMEEMRHNGSESVLATKPDGAIDLNELETIVEEPSKVADKRLSSNRLSILQPFSPSSPLETPPPAEDGYDTNENNLLALFAKMQPLRASLDFLPMRLSHFHIRGNPLFPSACQDLESRREHLEQQWKKLEGDAESLRKELGEDKWVLVFRNAGRQALKMCESVARSYYKLKIALENGEQAGNMPTLTKKSESYEAKKTHYGPAIERVLAIIDRGVMDRLTVNGEILRLQSDMKRRWASLQADMKEIDVCLEELASSEARDKQLRDSVSTVMSTEPPRSLASSFLGGTDTPGSSPASSVVGGATDSRKNSFHGSRTPTPLVNGKTRQSSFASSRTSKPSPASGRLSSASSIPKRSPFGLSVNRDGKAPSASPSPLTARSEAISKKPEWPSRAPLQHDPSKPRWTSIAKPQSRDFPPLSALEPSPYVKTPVPRKTYAPRSVSTPVVGYGPAGRAPLTVTTTVTTTTRHTSNPTVELPSSIPRTTGHPPRKSSLPIPVLTTPAQPLSSSKMQPRPGSRLAASGRRSSMMPTRETTEPSDGNDADTESPSVARTMRPPSALASGRRSSMLPARPAGESPYMRPPSAIASDRRSSMMLRRPASTLDLSKALAAAAEEDRPKWRP